MKKTLRLVLIAVVLIATTLMLLAPDAGAVPSYTRKFGVECSTCHTMWGALTGAGVQFRLSGYRAISGKDLAPAEKEIELSKGLLPLPPWLPLSFITGVGYDYRSEKRHAADGTSNKSTASSINIEDASIFLSGPLGNKFAYFVEFPMFETKAWEFTPTGPGEANRTPGKNFSFEAESPAFEVAKFWWNSVFGDGLPRDSFNLLACISHPPMAYAPGKVRLSVNQYLLYERRALDLISPIRPKDFLSDEQEGRLFRVSEPQGFFEVNGMVVPGGAVTDVGKKQTFWMEYHAGISNGSNSITDNNSTKDFYGRFVMRYYGQSLGVFAYYSPDTYGSEIREQGATAGLMSGRDVKNSHFRIGPDMTLSLAPFGIPVWLENQYMHMRESNPTGFDKSFTWQGSFHQLNWQISKQAITYVRYEWMTGKTFDDTAVGGITKSKPREEDVVAGLQFLAMQNVKLIGEYRYHQFKDKASTPNQAKLTDNGFTTRVMFGF